MTVGIRDVARAAGVSTATVSRALGRGPVSDALREQVEAAVKATGYRPNLSARRLRSQAARTIGLIVADIRNPFFTAVSRAVEDAAFASGLRVILCNTDEDPAREAMYLRLMEEERVTGVIFAPTRVTLESLGARPLDFPVVLIDRAGPPGTHDSVVLDNVTASAALVDHVVARGWKRIGGLFGATSTTARERQAGYEAAMRRHGLTPDIRTVAPNAAAAEDAAARWLAAPDRPEALVLSNGQILMGAVRAARALGLAIPRDLALAGFDNEPWTDLIEPGLTVIEQPVAEIGAQAMQRLFERIAKPDQPVRKIVLSGRLVARGSTGTR
ncbi:LacI family DNA-binding transcriptional regulator [Methylobacterium brachiatum]|uniref:LacI family DNA-binding transcriptional regulator n=1 Tax=Methylobacterium brachiatum TaxID=269660 RepID=UPI000EFB4919|nr:LacI family DNA-binding transcriptional regulator [Methylobacterium brachiatum]AYO81832.1 LacI family DNA-binding transcriptional regulator [Methylobacterium brachiatum]